MKRACKTLNANTDKQNVSSPEKSGQAIRPLKINFVRMKCIVICSLFLFVAILACTDEPELQTKEYPFINTTGVNVTDAGAVFEGEVINEGTTSVIAYGFVFDYENPTIENSDTVTINKNFAKGKFTYSLNHSLKKNVWYMVRAFAQTPDNIIYGPSLNFESKGSNLEPWNYIGNLSLEGRGNAYEIICNKNTYLLFENNEFYTYNTALDAFSLKEKFPIDGYDYSKFTYFVVDKTIYALSSNSKYLHKFNPTLNTWKQLHLGPVVANFDEGYYGFAINNIGYFISDKYFHTYITSTDSWKVLKRPENITKIYNAIGLGSDAYVLGNSGQIWKFNSTDGWTPANKFFGAFGYENISFVHNGNIYYIAGNPDSDSKPAITLFKYDVTNNTITKASTFPELFAYYPTLYHSINNKIYFGYYNYSASTYTIWEYDESKNIQ